MNTARNGKIARLPHAIREQLNRRIQDAQPGENILAWLNALPEVQTILADQFNGLPLSKQNLSEWRLGGFVDWEFQSDFVSDTQDFAENATQLKQAVPGRLSEHLATVLAARCAQLLSDWDGSVTAEFTHQLRAFSSLSRTIAELRRNDLSTAKQHLAEAKIEEQRVKTEEEVIARFKTWVENRDVRAWIVKKHADESEREPRKMYNLPSHPESESVLPSQTVQTVGSAPVPGAVFCVPAENFVSTDQPEPTAEESGSVLPSQTVESGLQPSAFSPQPSSDATRRSRPAKSRAKKPVPAPSPILHSSFCLPPSPTSPQPSFDNTLHDPVPASDPNSGDIYANEPIRVPKSLRKGETNRDPDPQSYPSYDLYMRTCVNQPKKPIIPPLRQIPTKDDAPLY